MGQTVAGERLKTPYFIAFCIQQVGTIAPGMTGDMQTAGRVYVTTGSRGVFYGEPSR
jgi:hypothetical protein